jgi:hypothetical protein
MANDQKHLLVIARSARLRPTLFVYDPVAFNICADIKAVPAKTAKRTPQRNRCGSLLDSCRQVEQFNRQ